MKLEKLFESGDSSDLILPAKSINELQTNLERICNLNKAQKTITGSETSRLLSLKAITADKVIFTSTYSMIHLTNFKVNKTLPFSFENSNKNLQWIKIQLSSLCNLNNFINYIEGVEFVDCPLLIDISGLQNLNMLNWVSIYNTPFPNVAHLPKLVADLFIKKVDEFSCKDISTHLPNIQYIALEDIEKLTHIPHLVILPDNCQVKPVQDKDLFQRIDTIRISPNSTPKEKLRSMLEAQDIVLEYNLPKEASSI